MPERLNVLQIEIEFIRAEACLAALGRKGEEFKPVQLSPKVEENGVLRPPLSADELRCTALAV